MLCLFFGTLVDITSHILSFFHYRVSIASTLIGRGGVVNGSYADTAFIEGDYEDGGEGIHVNNGQSSPETASRAEFYEGIQVLGGDAPSGVGGNALHGESRPSYSI